MGESSNAAMALQRWELENSVQQVDDIDALFKYNAAEMQAVQQQKPWSKDPHFFKQ
jgi:COP9 signalosome complex subunit 5